MPPYFSYESFSKAHLAVSECFRRLTDLALLFEPRRDTPPTAGEVGAAFRALYDAAAAYEEISQGPNYSVLYEFTQAAERMATVCGVEGENAHEAVYKLAKSVLSHVIACLVPPPPPWKDTWDIFELKFDPPMGIGAANEMRFDKAADDDNKRPKSHRKSRSPLKVHTNTAKAFRSYCERRNRHFLELVTEDRLPLIAERLQFLKFPDLKDFSAWIAREHARACDSLEKHHFGPSSTSASRVMGGETTQTATDFSRSRLRDETERIVGSSTPTQSSSIRSSGNDLPPDPLTGPHGKTAHGKRAAAKRPRSKEIEVYRIFAAMLRQGQTLTQGEIAKIYAEKKQCLPPTQGTISRWMRRVEAWLHAGNVLPELPKLTQKPPAINSKKIDMGEREDRHTPRQRLNKSAD